MTPNFNFSYSALIIFLLSLSACKTEPQTKSATSEQQKDFTVTTRLEAEPDRLNPVLTWRGWSIQVNNHIFPTLLEYHPQTEELSPVLAKARPEVRMIEDGPFKGGMAYTFEIHETAVWDNGQPVLGSDYAFTVKAVMNPQTGGGAAVFRSALNVIKAVDIDPNDPKKFTVTIFPASFRGEYTAGGFGIIPASIYDPAGIMQQFELSDIVDPEKAQQLVTDHPELNQFGEQFTSEQYSRDIVSGAGAYALKKWTSGEQLVLEKKKDWWGDALSDRYPMLTANPQRIVYRFIPDFTATISLMRNGEVDIANYFPNSLFKQLEQDATFTKDFNLLAPESYLLAFVGLNTQNPKLSDKRVRRALAHLLDTKEIINTVKMGMAIPIAGPIPPSVSFHNAELPLIDVNIEKAKTLLNDAGWSDSNSDGTLDKVIDGQREELVLSYLMSPNSQISEDIALIFDNIAKRAGVRIKPEVKEANAFRDGLKKRDFDLYTASSRIDPNSYDPYQSWHSSSNNPNGSNRVGFGSAESDELIERIRTTMELKDRSPLLKQLQAMIYKEQPAIYIYNTKEALVVSKRLKNAEPSQRSPGFFENYFQIN